MSETSDSVRVQLGAQPSADDAENIQIPRDHPDLIVDPTREDLELADAFERGEVGAYEYADGHTYPQNREIPFTSRRRRNDAGRIH